MKLLFLGRICILLMVSIPLMACFPESRTARYSAPKPVATKPKATTPAASQRATDDTKHVVRRGETLYSIAWRYKLNYKLLAGWNKVGSPYTIFPGQTLVLTGPAVLPTVAKATVPVKPKANSLPVELPKVTVPVVPQNKTKTTSVPTPKVIQPTKQQSDLAAQADKEPKSWQWPLKGKILRRFSKGAEGKQGIDIAGRIGTPIKSAAAGRVVYSGTGLKGYGRLIIIKHGERFLSAYAHNDRLLVKEGQIVKPGQIIAELGDSGTSTPMLHFELRDSGFPIDPQIYLPK